MTPRRNNRNLSLVGPILVIIVPESMCCFSDLYVWIAHVLSRAVQPEKSSNQWNGQISPWRDSNDLTCSVSVVSWIIPLLLVVGMKNLFHPAEYRQLLSEGFSCQSIGSEMKVNSNLSANDLAGFVVFLCGSMLLAPTGNESWLHQCFSWENSSSLRLPGKACTVLQRTTFAVVTVTSLSPEEEVSPFEMISEFFQQIGEENLFLL